MHITLEHTSDLPMYEQIKEAIKQEIYDGKLADQELLPSVRQLAVQLNVSAITTKRAYIELEHEGLVYTISGKGTYVSLQNVNQLKEERVHKCMEQIEKDLLTAKELGISKEDFLKLLEKIYGGDTDECITD